MTILLLTILIITQATDVAAKEPSDRERICLVIFTELGLPAETICQGKLLKHETEYGKFDVLLRARYNIEVRRVEYSSMIVWTFTLRAKREAKEFNLR